MAENGISAGGNVASDSVNKTEKSYVDTLVTSLASGSPKGTYPTLSALQTAYPSGDTNTYIVTADGQWYYWNGTAWTAGGMYQSSGIADDMVTVDRTDYILIGKNIFNKNKVTNGIALNIKGVQTSNPIYCVSDYIPIVADTNYARTVSSICYYNSNKEFISGIASGTTSFHTPVNAKYLRVTTRITNVETTQIEVGTVSTIYEPFKLVSDYLSITKDNLDADILQELSLSQLNNFKFLVGKNKFNRNTVINGKTLLDGSLVDNATFSVSDFIPVNPNTQYVCNKTVVVSFHDYNRGYIGTISIPAGTAITTPYDALYVRISVLTSRVSDMQFELGAISTNYEDFKVVLQNVAVEENVLSDSVKAKLNSLSMVKTIPEKPLNIAFTGSSITWGEGYLDDSFVAYIDDYLRINLADTIMHNNMTYVGNNTTIANRKFYKGTATKLSDINSEVEFKITGNELSLSLCKERSNLGASLVDLYVDGILYDTFSTYNDEQSGHNQKTFIGDGKTVKFDLGKCNTYGHVITVGGIAKTGVMNTFGSGATIPSNKDYMIIRKYGTNVDTGETEVHHYVWFKVPPTESAKIVVDFDYGENILYAKTTIGETACGVDSVLESSYGDGDTAYDSENSTALSSGLDFRYTDPRAIKTWKFTENATRNIKLVVKSLDPRVTTGTPNFIINFATNRYHHVMNAGIGGFDSGELLTDTKLKGISELMKFIPDIVFFESGTNDDWGCSFVSTRKITNVTEAEVRRYPTLWLKSCTPVSADNYTLETSVLKIAGATNRSIKIDSTGVTFNDVKAGDIIVIGDYHGDNREVQSRVISSWDSINHIASFKKPLQFDGLFGLNNPADLANKEVRIRRLDTFAADYTECINTMKDYNPDVRIGLIDTGLSNYMSRLLIGYPDKIAEVAKNEDCKHIKSYDLLSDWQYSQTKDKTAYLNTARNTISNGSREYTLVNSSGVDPNGSSFGYTNFSVKVNGVERYGDGCYIDGGRAYAFDPALPATQLIASNWDGKRASLRNIPLKLVFTKNIPSTGDVIDVKYSSAKWSLDDCHVFGGQPGATIYGNSIIDGLRKLINDLL